MKLTGWTLGSSDDGDVPDTWNGEIWLVEAGHVTWMLASDWSSPAWSWAPAAGCTGQCWCHSPARSRCRGQFSVSGSFLLLRLEVAWLYPSRGDTVWGCRPAGSTRGPGPGSGSGPGSTSTGQTGNRGKCSLNFNFWIRSQLMEESPPPL